MMSRFSPAWIVLLLAGLTPAPALVCAAAPAVETRRPNVLFIAVDDLNHWVGYTGRNKQTLTPNIDRLAARGVAFTQSYCAAPACNPSRAALMSGLRPSTTGVYHNSNDWRPVIAQELTLVTTFRNAGYVALGAGKIYHGGYDRDREWDEYFRPGERAARARVRGSEPLRFGKLTGAKLDGGDDAVSDYAIADYCIDQLGKSHDRPFFLACGLHKPHLPWSVPRKYFELFPLDRIELPPHLDRDLDDVPPAGVQIARALGDHEAILAAGKWKEAIQAYLATIAYTDMNIGRLIDALDRSAYRDNTIVVLWGDHGWHLGEKEHWRKFALWEEATRAPLIWVAPGVTRPGGLCARTVDFMSIYPTLCDLGGVPVPGHVEGRSIKRLLVDPGAPWDLPALTTHGYQNHAVRTEGWRYIRYAGGEEELYDETKDPYEWKNLVDDPALAPIKAGLARSLPGVNKPEVRPTRRSRRP